VAQADAPSSPAAAAPPRPPPSAPGGGMAGKDRSRSPPQDGKRLERISRTLCAFGRYPAKRPAGLTVDSSGAFGIKALISSWGENNGADEGVMMQAVRRHMFHEDGSLRFAVDSDEAGQVLIRVQPRRRAQRGGGGDPEPEPDTWPRWSKEHRRGGEGEGGRRGGGGGGGGCGGGNAWRSGPTARDMVRLWRGGGVGCGGGDVPAARAPAAAEALDMPLDAVVRARGLEPSAGTDASKKLTASEKLDLPLAALIRTEASGREGRWVRPAADVAPPGEEWWGRPAHGGVHGSAQEAGGAARRREGTLEASGGDVSERRERLQRACRQMGWAPESRHLRQVACGVGRFGSMQGQGSKAWNTGRHWGEQVPSAAEQVLRWLTWVIRGGYSEVHVELCANSAVRLQEVALAMPKRFGEFDGDRLRVLLQESDAEGRFAISPEGLLRLVPRDGRQRRRPRSRSPTPPSSVRDDGCLRGRRQRSSSSSMSRSPSCDAAFGGGGRGRSPSPAAAARAGTAVVGAEAPGASAGNAGTGGGAALLPGARGSPPPPPPGPLWQQYKDGETIWWFYGGPLGEWWCPEGGNSPQPYSADE